MTWERPETGSLARQTENLVALITTDRCGWSMRDLTTVHRPSIPAKDQSSEGLLFFAALLTGVCHPKLPGGCWHAIWRSALSAFCLYPSLALLNCDGFPLDCFLHQAFRLFPHRLFWHFIPVLPSPGSHMRPKALQGFAPRLHENDCGTLARRITG